MPSRSSLNTKDVVARFVRCKVYDLNGIRLGPVTGLWLSESDEPLFAAIATGPREDDCRVVPLAEATLSDGRLRLPHAATAIREAPPLPSTLPPSPLEIARLLDHYRSDGANRLRPPRANKEPGVSASRPTLEPVERPLAQARRAQAL